MRKWIMGLSLSSVTFAALFVATVQAEERIRALDKMMYTINPSGKVSGPVFRDMSSKSEKSRYVSSLISLILKEADVKARKYYEAGDTQAYYAYMAMSLAVPLHEGVFIHFRNVDGSDVCQAEANNGEMIRRINSTTHGLFTRAFKTPGNPYFPNCEEIRKTSGINQMIRGSDGTDMSIMQISLRWHFDEYFAPRKFESVQSTLGYGFNHLMSGFDPVYRNISDYRCIYDASLGRRKINYINLVRGVWAGKYNSGSISQTCRFADPNSAFKKHDQNFARNLNKILNFNGVITMDYVGDIPVEGAAASAIREIVNNLTKNKNDRFELEKILADN